MWHSTDKYRKTIWQCNNKFKNKEKCKTPNLTEEQIKEEFVKEFNRLIANKDEIIKDCENAILELTNTENIDAKISKLQEENEALINLMKNLIYENSRKAINQDEYNKKYDSYTEKHEKIKNAISKLEEKKQNLKVRREKISLFMDNLRKTGSIISEFNEILWHTMVENVIIHDNKKMEFRFKNLD
ncbi:MAG: hypothetical protein Q4B84_04945 [Clostridia bacterium]|nr:hypothetical protein [Clostridia bacterium]